MCIAVVEQNQTGIGSQAATSAVEGNRFGPDRCQGQRCLVQLGCPIGLHGIKTGDQLCVEELSVQAGSLLKW